MGAFGEPIHICERADGIVLLLVFLAGHNFGDAHNNAAGVEIVIESLALAQEFRAENQVEFLHALGAILNIQSTSIAHGDSALDDHHGVRIHLQHSVNDGLYRTGIKEVLLTVIVGRSGNNDKFRVAVASLLIQCSLQRKRLIGQIILDVVVLNGRLFVVDEVDAFLDHVDSCDVVMLCQQGGDTKSYIAGSGD